MLNGDPTAVQDTYFGLLDGKRRALYRGNSGRYAKKKEGNKSKAKIDEYKAFRIGVELPVLLGIHSMKKST